jgi:integrase
MPKLTDASIKAATCPPEKSRLELSDASCPGLILRVTRAGSKTFTFKYWSPILSKTVSLSLGTYPALSLAAVRDKVADHRKTIAGDQDPRAEQRRNRRQFARSEELTFDQLSNKFIAEYVIGGQGGAEAVQTWIETNKWPDVKNPNKSSWKNDVGYLKKPRLHWGHLPANSITEDDAADLLDMIAEDAPVSANRTQSILHTMFKWAKQPGTKARKLVTHNPLAGLSQRGGKEKKRERVLSDVEIKTLWWGLDREELPADRTTALGLKFILTTMVRPYQSAYAEVSELLDLDGTDPEYHLPPKRVKRRRPVIVPLSDLACEIVDEALGEQGPDCHVSIAPERRRRIDPARCARSSTQRQEK